MRTRENLWRSGDGWSETLLWYARGVERLKNRPLSDPTSWRSQAASHGFDEGLWRDFGYLGDGDEFPLERRALWEQCQHQSWYFLPWHRGYIAAFEATLRDALSGDGIPGGWALPYWNCDAEDPRSLSLHPAFADRRHPDHPDDPKMVNPLFVERRYGGDGHGTVSISPEDIDPRAALIEDLFAGSASGGTTGFGGPETRFSHSGPRSGNGILERQPHNIIHSLVGGRVPDPNADPEDGRSYGLMSMPETAALDPIFWIHHANIDRLWEVWLRRDPVRHVNAKADAWKTGPTDRAFAMPAPDGSVRAFAAADMLDTEAPGLGYTYDDVTDPLGGLTRRSVRAKALVASGGQDEGFATAISTRGSKMTDWRTPELLGSNEAEVRLSGSGVVATALRTEPSGNAELVKSFAKSAVAGRGPSEPDRVFVNLEGIRGLNDSAVVYVYLNLPKGAPPADYSNRLIGVVSLFGARKATRSDGIRAGSGLNEVLEITHNVDELQTAGELDLDHLEVSFVSRTELRPEDAISIGRVSIYRQSAKP